MHIKIDDLSGPQIHRLLQQHLQAMTLYSPPESIHALDLTALRRPDITFWTVWDGDELLGCGALRALGGQQGELKSMRTASAHLRKGVARALLNHIVDEALCRNYTRLSLETGSAPAFDPARQLYASAGFVPCGPFEGYSDDPFSVFMTRVL
jgi:putative acetyltransferase